MPFGLLTQKCDLTMLYIELALLFIQLFFLFRYLRIIEELQRGEVWDLSREEKLAFFINLYNMMTIHATLVWGHPSGALERRKIFEDFQYVIGGFTYSLSAIQNGILRANQRQPYTLLKPFGAKDKRLRVRYPCSILYSFNL